MFWGHNLILHNFFPSQLQNTHLLLSTASGCFLTKTSYWKRKDWKHDSQKPVVSCLILWESDVSDEW